MPLLAWKVNASSALRVSSEQTEDENASVESAVAADQAAAAGRGHYVVDHGTDKAAGRPSRMTKRREVGEVVAVVASAATYPCK